MKVRKYLHDRRYLIIFFTILMTFIIGIEFFDSSIRMVKPNGIYVGTVSFLLFIIYLIIDYSIISHNMIKISLIAKQDSMDWVSGLPSAVNNEQEFYLNIIKKLYKDANMQIEELNHQNNESVEFITTWVHEIKTPIAASKLIIENNISSQNEKVLYGIEREINKIEDYVQQALFHSRMNNFSKDYRIESVAIKALIKESVKSEATYFINKNINVHLNNLDMEVNSDYKWLRFIIKQILDNSIKYTSKHGNIKIYGEVFDKETVLYIEDDGIGIKEEDLSRVFEKSFTGWNGRIKQHSTGMGLYISQKLAKKLGHYITISSEYEKGTVVSIHFPKWNDYLSF